MPGGEVQAGAPEAQEIRVVTETRNLRSRPFVVPDETNSVGKAWEEWLEGIEREFRYFKITGAVDKKDAMIIYGGKEIARLEKSLPDAEIEDVYVKLRTKLNEHFTPKKNKHHARYLFLKMRPYAARLREKAKECEFGDTYDERILEHIIQTIDNKKLIEKAISKTWDLTRFLTEASQTEDIARQMLDMESGHSQGSPDNISRIYSEPLNHKQSADESHGFRRPWRPGKEQDNMKQQRCGFCGLTGVHAKGRDCPAYGKKCRKCHKWNHYSSVCKSDGFRGQNSRGRKPSRGRIRGRIKKTTEDAESTSSDDEFFGQAAEHLAQAKKVKEDGSNYRIVTVQLNDVDVEMEADSGADVNILDEHQFKAFIHRTHDKPILEASKVKLHTLQHQLEVKGEFQAVIRNETCGKLARFVVVFGRIQSPPLISKETLIDLGMLKIRPDGGFAEPNGLGTSKEVHGANAVKELEGVQEMKDLVTKYSHLFKGIGKIEDKKGDREILGRFHMKPEAVPVAQKPRQVPYYLQEPFRRWLDQGIEEDIFEKVPDDEPITWCSPVVVQPKPKFSGMSSEKLEPHMIRASVDLRVPNKHMERSRISQAPVVEDFIYKFHDCTIWTKLDLRQGYHQLVLHPESRSIATFSTPWGNFRPKRLVFGAKASQDLFDEEMNRIFGDIPRCLNQRDDILIGASNWKEHNDTLETVFQRAEDYGITLNEPKCEFGQAQITFYGYRFGKDGLKPTPEKVQAIQECTPPESKGEVRSFLGMTGYLSKFIPRYSSLTKPLRELTHKEAKFRWGPEEANAFEELKASISSQDTMAFFNPKLPIMMRVEASYNEGLSAGLFQQSTKGWQPVHFISRTLTDVEKRYSQTEKDALCVKWAKDRFSIYLLGAPKFTIVTAHKPLLPLFNKPTAKLPPRIEKWVMDMQNVDYEMKYEPGKNEADPLDFLSRHPLPIIGNNDTEKILKATIETEHAVVLDRIKEETQQDGVMQKLSQTIQRGDWEASRKDVDLAPFYPIKEEIYEAQGLIFRMERIILPSGLQQKIIKTAHKLGHLGTTKTKQMLRAKYWFPNMNAMIDQTIGHCYDCQVTTRNHREEPIKPSVIPEEPWEQITIDFGGPYPDGHYNLVAVDRRTRYPEVEVVSSTAFKPTKERLRKMFAHHGVPRRVYSDNGPPFNSKEFSDFAEEEGFQHHRITPLHPRANGQVERFMQVLNKTEQIAHLQGKTGLDRSIAVQDMLMAYRDTPHPATGVTPYQAMTNRPVRTKLDYTMPGKERSKQDESIDEKDRRYKEKMKREGANIKEHNFILGDYVLLRQRKSNKWSTPYEPVFYTVTKISGSTITARRITDGREICRDSSQFKLANAIMHRGSTEAASREDWREKLLMNAGNTSDQPSEHTTQLQTIPEQGSIPEQESVLTQGNAADELRPTEESHPATAAAQDRVQESPGIHSSRPKRLRRRPAYLTDYVT